MIVYEASCKTDFSPVSYLQVNSCGYENMKLKGKVREDARKLLVEIVRSLNKE